MGRVRQLTWAFEDENELLRWMEGRDVVLTGDMLKVNNRNLQVSFLVDFDRHQEILRLDEPIDEDSFDD